VVTSLTSAIPSIDAFATGLRGVDELHQRDPVDWRVTTGLRRM